MKKPNLKNLLSKWQKKLRLADWRITIAYGRKAQMENLLGCININQPYRMAEIKILHPEDWTEPLKVEFTVLHELLHIYFKPLTPEGEILAEEQAINAITEALLEK